jgi:hypothetical protein
MDARPQLSKALAADRLRSSMGGGRASVESSGTAEEVFIESRACPASASLWEVAIAVASPQARQKRLRDFVSSQFS